MRRPLPTGIIPYASRGKERSVFFAVFGPHPVGRAGGHVVRRGVVAASPARTRRGIRRGISLVERLVRRRVAPLAGGHGGVPCPAERELRARREGGVLRGPRGGGANPDLEPRIPPVGERYRVATRDLVVGPVGGFGALRCRHVAGEGVAALVRGGAHRSLPHHGPLGCVREHMVRAGMAGAGIRALVAEGYPCRPTLARELSFRQFASEKPVQTRPTPCG